MGVVSSYNTAFYLVSSHHGTFVCYRVAMGKNREFSLTEFLLDPRLSETPSEEHVKKWLEYKKKRSGIKDPDGTEDAHAFYSYLWGEEIRTYQLVNTKPFPIYVQGDWMCSVWTTLRLGLKLFDSQALEDADIALDDNGCPTRESCLQNGKLLKNFDRFTLLNDERVHAFIYNAYTRANLIIVPKGLNRNRGGIPTNDYWDKALERLLQPISVTTKGRSLMEYAEFFQRLLNHFGIDETDEAFKADPSKAPLFLRGWITEDRKPKWILGKDEEGIDMAKKWRDVSWKKLVESITEQEWWKLIQTMTYRIENRRKAMQDYLGSLNRQ